jgi:prevent-host-death family protein
MAEVVPVSEAKTRLTELLRRVEAGEDVVISRNGVEVAELRPRRAPDRARAFGAFAGQVSGDVLGPVPELDGWELGEVAGT